MKPFTSERRGYRSTSPAPFIKISSRSSNHPNYITSKGNHNRIMDRIAAEAAQCTPGSEMHAWLVKLGGLA